MRTPVSHFTNKKTDATGPEPKAGPWESRAGQPSAPCPGPGGERALSLSPPAAPQGAGQACQPDGWSSQLPPEAAMAGCVVLPHVSESRSLMKYPNRGVSGG